MSSVQTVFGFVIKEKTLNHFGYDGYTVYVYGAVDVAEARAAARSDVKRGRICHVVSDQDRYEVIRKVQRLARCENINSSSSILYLNGAAKVSA